MKTSHGRTERWFAAHWPVCLLGIAATAVAAWALAGARGVLWVPEPGPCFFDLDIYRESASVFLSGRMLYSATFALGFGFTYPPVAVIVFAPLAVLPIAVCEVAVTALNLALVVALAGLSVALADRSRGAAGEHRGHGSGDRQRRIALAATVALLSEPVITTIGYGQIDLLIAVLVLGDLTVGTRMGRGGGWAIGAAAALKLTPLVFIPYLLITRRRGMAGRALAGFGVGIAVAFLVEPWNAWAYWGGKLLDTRRVAGHGPHSGRGQANQSLRGAIMRLGTGGVTHEAIIWGLASLIVVLGGLWFARRATLRGRELTGFVLTGIVGLLVCPVTWTHHWVITLPGVLALVVRSGGRGTRRAVTWVVVMCAVLSPLVWVPMNEDRSGAHLGVMEFLLDDLYVIVGLATLLAAGVVEWRLARRLSAVRRRPQLRGMPDGVSGQFRVARNRAVIDNPAS